jgi:hypothetical protein
MHVHCVDEAFLYAHVLTLFVPRFCHVDLTGGALIGRTPQKLCRLKAIFLSLT